MATHNQVRIVGYVSSGPRIHYDSDGLEDRVTFAITAVRRDIQGYRGNRLTTVNVLYTGDYDDPLMQQMADTHPYDLLDIKGVIQILDTSRSSECPSCENLNFSNATILVVTPQFIARIGSLAAAHDLACLRAGDEETASYLNISPEFTLIRKYKEVSNQALIIGHVITDPAAINDEDGNLIACRYMVAVDRKFVISRSDDPRKAADYPWVYSYGNQAARDLERLRGANDEGTGSEVFVEAAVTTEEVTKRWKCEQCGSFYETSVTGSKLIAYSVEYFDNYLTDEEKKKQEEAEDIKKQLNV